MRKYKLLSIIQLTILSLVFTFTAVSQPTGTVTEGPSSIRAFRPESMPDDDAIESYFNAAGPLAIEFYEHLTLLANPWLGGRQPGTEGSQIAGEYITWNMQKYNLIPAFNNQTNLYQNFDFNVDSTAPEVIESFVLGPDAVSYTHLTLPTSDLV